MIHLLTFIYLAAGTATADGIVLGNMNPCSLLDVAVPRKTSLLVGRDNLCSKISSLSNID